MEGGKERLREMVVDKYTGSSEYINGTRVGLVN